MKKLQHFLPLMALCMVLLFFLPQQADAASASDLTFTLNANGNSYSVTDCDESAGGTLTIPSTYNGKPVTGIGDYAFSNCTGLTGITIPDSVTSIGTHAFYDCTGLTGITIPDSVTNMGGAAFRGCSSLESITIPFVGNMKKTASSTYQFSETRTKSGIMRRIRVGSASSFFLTTNFSPSLLLCFSLNTIVTIHSHV